MIRSMIRGILNERRRDRAIRRRPCPFHSFAKVVDGVVRCDLADYPIATPGYECHNGQKWEQP